MDYGSKDCNPRSSTSSFHKPLSSQARAQRKRGREGAPQSHESCNSQVLQRRRADLMSASIRVRFIRMLTGCSPGSPTMAGSCWKNQDSSNCLVHKAGCLSSSNLVLKAWTIPGEMLVLSLCLKSKEVVLITAKEYSRNTWICQQEWRRAAKRQRFLPCALSRGLPPDGNALHVVWVFLLQTI